MNNPVVYSYKGSEISFMSGDSVLINATQMAKPFGKRPNDYLSLPTTVELIQAITRKSGKSENQLVITKTGMPQFGGGTWMHEDVAIDFAQWLSVDFRLWVNDRIKELLMYGMTATQPTLEQVLLNPDLVISLATQLKTERAENNRLQSKLIEQKVLIEQKEDTITLIERERKEDAPKLEYFDTTLSSKGLLTVNMIAACLNMSPIKLNKLLCEWNVQYKQSGTYFLFSQHRGKGLTEHRPHPYPASDGTIKTRQHMYWTELGKRFIIKLYNSKMAA